MKSLKEALVKKNQRLIRGIPKLQNREIVLYDDSYWRVLTNPKEIDLLSDKIKGINRKTDSILYNIDDHGDSHFIEIKDLDKSKIKSIYRFPNDYEETITSIEMLKTMVIESVLQAVIELSQKGSFLVWER